MKKVVLFSSNTKKRDSSSGCEVFPKWSDQWDQAAESHPELDITLVTQLNGRYFLDIADGKTSRLPKNIRVVTLPMDASAEDFIDAVIELKPDIAAAINGPVSGYDWNGIRDAAIAEGIRKAGIECICYSVQTAMDCFDKCMTHRFLKDHGFRVSNAVYIDHELFVTRKHEKASTKNAYLEAVLYQVKQLKAPLVIKSSTGSSSMGIVIARTYEEAEKHLLSEAFDGDVIVEEKFTGEEYGLEIHGCSGNYIVTPPYHIFRYGGEELNDPLGDTTLKYGPMLGSKYKVDELTAEMKRLAELMGLAGIIEVDLFFSEGEWYILELNNRWSGLTTLITASQDRLPYDVFLDQITGTKKDLNDFSNYKYCLQFKAPKADRALLSHMVEEGAAQSVISYEVIFPNGDKRLFNDTVSKGCDSLEELGQSLVKIREKYPQAITEASLKAVLADMENEKEH